MQVSVFYFFRSNYITYLRHAFILCYRFYQQTIPNGMKTNVPAGQNVGRKFVLHAQWRAVGTQCGTRIFLTISNIFYTPPEWGRTTRDLYISTSILILTRFFCHPCNEEMRFLYLPDTCFRQSAANICSSVDL
jgi:hypothetical protein